MLSAVAASSEVGFGSSVAVVSAVAASSEVGFGSSVALVSAVAALSEVGFGSSVALVSAVAASSKVGFGSSVALVSAVAASSEVGFGSSVAVVSAVAALSEVGFGSSVALVSAVAASSEVGFASSVSLLSGVGSVAADSWFCADSMLSTNSSVFTVCCLVSADSLLPLPSTVGWLSSVCFVSPVSLLRFSSSVLLSFVSTSPELSDPLARFEVDTRLLGLSWHLIPGTLAMGWKVKRTKEAQRTTALDFNHDAQSLGLIIFRRLFIPSLLTPAVRTPVFSFQVPTHPVPQKHEGRLILWRNLSLKGSERP